MYNKVIIIIIIIKLSTKVQITWQRMSIGYLEPLVLYKISTELCVVFEEIQCSSNSARYCFGIVYHCSAMVEVLGK